MSIVEAKRVLNLCDQAWKSPEALATLNGLAVEWGLGDANTEPAVLIGRAKKLAELSIKALPPPCVDDIKPGKNYPTSVTITEMVEGKEMEIRFLLQSYIVGMYCAIHFRKGDVPAQTGDHDNKKFVKGLVKDIKKAIRRGAKVEIGSIAPVKTMEGK
jgi:hypothetical protein